MRTRVHAYSSTDVVVSVLLGPESLRTQLCKEDITWLRGIVGMEGVTIVPRPAHSKKKAQRQQEGQAKPSTPAADGAVADSTAATTSSAGAGETGTSSVQAAEASAPATA